VFHIRDHWYVVCFSKNLTRNPVAAMLFDVPIVLFRNAIGEIGAFVDRCPHRNVPLSLGTVVGQTLQCSYHGWEFDANGVCVHVPGCIGGFPSHRVPAFPVRESQGCVWVYATPDTEPRREPCVLPLTDNSGYTTVREEFVVDGSIHAVAENALDVPHTAYLHGGLFRSEGGRRKEIEVVVTRHHDRVEAEYIGEDRPSGIAGRILAPSGGAVVHVDRFVLPSIAQVEYRIGDATHFCVTSALTPVSDSRTRLFVSISVRLPFPAGMVLPLLRPLLLRIFRQDAQILRHQVETIRVFGGEHFHSTEVDTMGPHIYRLLKESERGDPNDPGEPFVKRTRMLL
jgi:phenylpropionate dioxygenase-like ring-hydroxylating dioxygenase large terminal subunit